MHNTIHYLNTDLDLVSPNVDPTAALAAVFDSCGVFPLRVDREADGLWYAKFETRDSHPGPEPNVAAMVAWSS